MRPLKTFALLLFSASLLWACSGRTTSKTGQSGPSAASDSATSGPSGVASFSATIDGKSVSGGAIDELQQANSAYIVPDGDHDENVILFHLADNKITGSPDYNYSLRCYFPDKVGSYTITTDQDKRYSITVDIQPDRDHFAQYNTDTLTVNINSITAIRVSGTFSGKFTLSPDTPRAEKKEITITDGKFDIPFSSSKLIPA